MTRTRTPTKRCRPKKTDGGHERASLSAEIVLAVADRTETSVTDLPPLYETINPEALDRLAKNGDGRRVSISFEYADHRIDVTNDDFEIRPADSDG